MHPRSPSPTWPDHDRQESQSLLYLVKDFCYLVRTGPAAAARTLADVDLPCVVPLQQLQVTINGIATGLRNTG